MSVNLGLYDLFANAVPGLLYLYVLSECGKLLGFSGLDFTKIENTAQVLGIVFLSFILGHVFNAITYRFWFRLWVRRRSGEVALRKLQAKHPEKHFDFQSNDPDILVSIIQHNDMKVADRLETARANAIMMRNVSFGLFLHGLLYIAKILIGGVSTLSIVIVVISFICSGFALYRCADYDRWFFRDVFCEALAYGNTFQEVLAASRSKSGFAKPDEKNVKPTKK